MFCSFPIVKLFIILVPAFTGYFDGKYKSDKGYGIRRDRVCVQGLVMSRIHCFKGNESFASYIQIQNKKPRKHLTLVTCYDV